MPVPFKTLTKTQQNYLARISLGGLAQGWGGYGSTRTVRLLEERGLVHLTRTPHIVKNGRRAETWKASLTQAGWDWLAARRAG